MGRLSGFGYREIIKRLKRLGFEFDRQAAGSHEIWFNLSGCNSPNLASLFHQHSQKIRKRRNNEKL